MPSLLPCREVTGGLVLTAGNTHYKRGGSPVLPSLPECIDSHELETLMSTDRGETAHLPDEASEDQRLMPSDPGDEEELPPTEPKVKIIFTADNFLQHRAFLKKKQKKNVVIVVVILVNLLHCRSYRLPGMAQ